VSRLLFIITVQYLIPGKSWMLDCGGTGKLCLLVRRTS
jgi:hypothetical protein